MNNMGRRTPLDMFPFDKRGLDLLALFLDSA